MLSVDWKMEGKKEEREGRKGEGKEGKRKGWRREGLTSLPDPQLWLDTAGNTQAAQAMFPVALNSHIPLMFSIYTA